MKRPTMPISHFFFKSPNSPTVSSMDVGKRSIHTLVSYFLNMEFHRTIASPRLHFYHAKTLPSSSITPLNHEFTQTNFTGSSKQPKPINKITSIDQNLPPTATGLKFRTNFSSTSIQSGKYLNDGISCTRFLNSSRKPEPMFKIISFDRMFYKFTQKRSFSSAPSDPFSVKPMEFGSSDSIPVNSTMSPRFESSAPIDAGHSMRKPISLWPGMYHSPVTNALWEARSSIFERLNNVAADAPSPNELIAKPPSKSRTSIVYKFSTDYILREQYRNPWNEIRMGKLVEDLDALAGTISFKHCSSADSTTMPLLLVTASVDKIVLRRPIRVDTDLTIVGAVTWVGRSSLEIQLEVTQSAQETSSQSDSLALTANFTFVARDSRTGKSAPVNQISPETEREKLLWEEAEERNQIRKKKRGEKRQGIDNDEETKRLNELLAEGRVFCDMPALADRDSILIRDTCLQNSLICQPQQRNIHGRIFGGFLMRRAFELAFATAYSFAGAAPRFVEVDHVDFLKPVDVGNFLRVKSCVLYTELENPDKPMINVEVVAHVTRPEFRSSEVSNKFYFTFTVRPDAIKDGLKIRNVVPATEEEAKRVIERMDAEKK
ncbi:acyl-coenzyme A thioesterase 9, mitochondrial-like [Coffea eugenioides]|uniref:acyl-coenzyme A thioesterase 9, mitochondrial-like n=1 Tax=Coffea eugenioides TaxID=49369 RepID=UPI000F60E6AB|nr:acyl-coenzyme A thioesterase 9, mitochondrial-like [Coffea eugenioides]